ncbi:Uncharacterized conserved protein YdiU, UPF0061 family [Marinobacter sp. DSM 26671]|nr:Uncharacterized conserved protein YdiU, UPF0061 family [Marinobacter sp. DSM 26671]
MTGMCFDNSYARLPGVFFSRCDPVPVADPELVFFNRSLASDLGLNDPEVIDDHALLSSVFSGNRLPVGAQPIATAFAGHRFGAFVPEIGDQRALLLGEVIDRCQQRRDIQLVGVGKTPFSSGDDGPCSLSAAVREAVLTEAMNALGVPTTRVLALTRTGDSTRSDSPKPEVILTRVANSHIRIGTFEYFARSQNKEALETLADYTIARLCPELMVKPDPYLSLLRWAVDRQARLVAHWVSLGFVHGAMDTDKNSLAGETLDYTEAAFLDVYDPDKVFNPRDITGRYAYNSQAFAAQWNLSRLAEALIGLFHGSESKAFAEASKAVREFRARYEDYLLNLMRKRLGFDGAMPQDRELVQDLRHLLARNKVDYHSFFNKVAEDVEGGGITAALFGSDAGLYLDWYRRWHLRLTVTGRGVERCAEVIMASNPQVIPRNHLIERAVERARNNDFGEFFRLLESVRKPFNFSDDL